MTPQERYEVLARLAAGEILSLKDEEIGAHQFDNELNASINIISVLNIPAHAVDNVRRTLIQHLQDSDLTINFRAPKFFTNLPTGSFRNAWQQGNRGIAYLASRDNVEERLFDYSNTGGRSAPPSVLARINLFGSRSSGTGANNPFFQAVMRPKYGGLNYTGALHGAASDYSGSYFILKEHVKHNATFTNRDSFDYLNSPNPACETANFHNLDRLIAKMKPHRLIKLYNAATGLRLPLPANYPILDYIEAQLHADIQFNRDVSGICIDNYKIDNALRGKAQEFARENGIPLQFI